MKLNQIRDNKGARKKFKALGRGIGSGKGKTAGRGVKGQLARSGVTGIRRFEGGQMPLYRRIPKRGFNNIFAKEFSVINLGRVQQAIESGLLDANQPITSKQLMSTGIAKKAANGVRLLGKGDIKAKIQITVDGASASAVAAVEKAGGKVTITEVKKPTPKVKAKA
jgi:large subunit ribosomal protein L15